MKVFYVMVGGFFGAICRYGLGEWVYTNGFPTGTLIVNLIGCFFLGWFLTFTAQKNWIHKELSLLIGTGFTGSFTTFSTFSVETVQLIQDKAFFYGGLYVILSIVVGIVFSFLGYKIALLKWGSAS